MAQTAGREVAIWKKLSLYGYVPTKCEQGLCTALLCPQPAHCQHLLQRHVGATSRLGRLCKCAVSAGIPAQPGQGDEHLRAAVKNHGLAVKHSSPSRPASLDTCTPQLTAGNASACCEHRHAQINAACTCSYRHYIHQPSTTLLLLLMLKQTQSNR